MANDANRNNRHRRRINKNNIKRYKHGGGVGRSAMCRTSRDCRGNYTCNAGRCVPPSSIGDPVQGIPGMNNECWTQGMMSGCSVSADLPPETYQSDQCEIYCTNYCMSSGAYVNSSSCIPYPNSPYGGDQGSCQCECCPLG